MELGQRLRQARLEAGLSQQQLCGERITRNMLSQIENGRAKPSMDTLQYLAAQLGRPVGWFLQEEGDKLSVAKAYLEEGKPEKAAALLKEPASAEERLVARMALLALGEKALSQGQKPYCKRLLEKAERLDDGCYGTLLRDKQALLWAQLEPGVRPLPCPDDQLLALAQAALLRQEPRRAAALLEAVEEQAQETWLLLRADAAFALGEFAQAAEGYGALEATRPEWVLRKLERCFEKLGDYRKAYEYACKGR